MKFCDKLVKQRKNNNLSQEQLADRLGVSRQAVSKWESGSSIPDMSKILELCKILNCNLEDLVDDGVKSNKDIYEARNSINNYLKEVLDFITRTINMFWSMTLIEKIKCILEIFFIFLILFGIWGIAGNIINSIFNNILIVLPNTIYRIIMGISSVIYGIFGLVAGIIIIIHIFKVRYLDYFVTIEDNNVNDKSVELPVDDNKSNEDKIKFIDKKKNKIIIRDPKHSTYNFFEFLARIVVWIIKFILILVSFPCVCSFIGICFGITISTFLIKDGIFFLGITILLLGCLLINYLILKVIYNFIVNLVFKFKKIFILFIMGLILVGIGSGISFCNYLTFDKVTLTNNDIEYSTKNFDIEMKDNLNLAFLLHDKVEIVYDDSLDNIKIEVTYDKDGNIELYKSTDQYYDDYEYFNYFDYDINYNLNYGDDFIEEINYLINEIKNKRRIYNDYPAISNIKIFISHNNLKKLEENYYKIYG